MKSILITGGAGFIGSNFLHYFLDKHGSEFDSVVCLDLLTYAGNLQNLEGLEAHKNYHFIKGDICDAALVAEIFAHHHIDSVIHFAAESHVDNSIASPEIFIKTNVYGTFTLLQTAYAAWFDAPFAPKKGFENALFHHISTDEVYGTLGATGLFSERTPYAPNSPYSASKASSDFVVRSYAHTYGLNAVITNCSNNYGPRQHAEKLIPTIIRRALAGKQIPIYGDGQNVRDWLFVNDHCEGICAVFDYAKQQIASRKRERERERNRVMKTHSTQNKFVAKMLKFIEFTSKIQQIQKFTPQTPKIHKKTAKIAKIYKKMLKFTEFAPQIHTKIPQIQQIHKPTATSTPSISAATRNTKISTSLDSFAPT